MRPCFLGFHLGDWAETAVCNLKWRYLKTPVSRGIRIVKFHLPHALLPLDKQRFGHENPKTKQEVT